MAKKNIGKINFVNSLQLREKIVKDLEYKNELLSKAFTDSTICEFPYVDEIDRIIANQVSTEFKFDKDAMYDIIGWYLYDTNHGNAKQVNATLGKKKFKVHSYESLYDYIVAYVNYTPEKGTK